MIQGYQEDIISDQSKLVNKEFYSLKFYHVIDVYIKHQKKRFCFSYSKSAQFVLVKDESQLMQISLSWCRSSVPLCCMEGTGLMLRSIIYVQGDKLRS